MPQNDGFDMGAFATHLNVIYHNQPTDIEPAGLDLFTHPSQPAGTKSTKADALQGAVASAGPRADGELGDMRPSLVDTDVVGRVADTGNSDAAAARDKLAQEALLANPAEMRRLFPTVLKDVSLNHNGYLDLAEIDKGLQNAQLSQTEKNFLTVLKAGYKEFSLGPTHAASDGLGVSATGLAMVDKALNRSIKEDPMFLYAAKRDLVVGPLAGATVGGLLVKNFADPKAKLLFMGGSVAFWTGLAEGLDVLGKFDGEEKATYDNVAKNYKSFVDKFENPNGA
jgi:hypothetical protein